MKSKAETENSPVDTIKLAVAALILIGGIFGFYYYGDQPQLYRVLGIVAVAGVAIAVAMTSQQGQALWSFLQDSRTETRKVVWPTRSETWRTTLLVMIVVMIVAIFLWLMDILLGWGVQRLILPGG
ncbi:preprotein translocase subunit SecE [Natronocella acetinitrilica]|uniref:Protein translocase subunit SecE n=1 Tax=Natronocella acetinitrilica TaxID=414046 RepID=A0AAE3G9Y2_9GAMM|nr:preprotein translocase subunit SecE [Natronocella acetinitrilica]MCP1677233.1 preprotein translocase subunit SecE [Natronocella acetinitrilica]